MAKTKENVIGAGGTGGVGGAYLGGAYLRGGGSPQNGEASGDGYIGTRMVTFSASGGDAGQRPLSFIEDHEIGSARAIVRESFKLASGGRDLNYRVVGYKLLVKIYVRPEELKTIQLDDGTTRTLYLPDTVRAEDKFQSVVGLVMDAGPDAYADKQQFPAPWCRIGDWVTFDRGNCKRVTICGVACAVLNDDAIDGVIDEPADIIAGHLDFKV